MTIFINGKKEDIEGDITVLELLKKKKIRPEVVTVELNDQIIAKDKYHQTKVNPDDRLELVYYMGGGTIDPVRKVFSNGVNAKRKIPACPGDTVVGRKNTKFLKNILELIGNTPMVRLNKIVEPNMADILAKDESFNPGGSIKDRICLSMIEDAENKGLISSGSTIIEPTSGNTGIGLAMVCAVRGYKCILTMPETMSLERIYILKSYGAQVILTPGLAGMQGSIKKAEALLKKTPNSFMPQQFTNAANPQIHRQTTAQEILKDANVQIDAFVVGVGTGGTITGVGEVLKKHNPQIKIVAVEPETSAVLSGKEPGPHKIQGIGAGFVPQVLNREIIDQIIQVSDNDAFKTARRLTKEEGLFVGISAGAAVWAALKIATKLGKGKTVVTVLPDTGERYFSMEQYFEM